MFYHDVDVKSHAKRPGAISTANNTVHAGVNRSGKITLRNDLSPKYIKTSLYSPIPGGG